MQNLFWVGLILLILSLQAQASENWLCTEESSLRSANAISSCGVGEGANESTARANALTAAKTEFTTLCEASDDCKGHLISVEPKRTTCEEKKGNYVCYRLVQFTIGKLQDDVKMEPASPKHHTQRMVPVTQDTDNEEIQFKPFVYESTLNQPKIKIGMTKRDLLHTFGMPDTTEKGTVAFNRWEQEFTFRGPMAEGRHAAFVELIGGKVVDYRNFKAIYTEELK